MLRAEMEEVRFMDLVGDADLVFLMKSSSRCGGGDGGKDICK